MTENKDEIEIWKNFNEDTRQEIRDLFDDNQNEHLVFLKKALQKNDNILKKIPVFVEYGLSRVRDDEDNFALSDYFFILSEIRGLSDDVHSFFTDVMIYCEDKMINFTNASQIKNYYIKKITPLL